MYMYRRARVAYCTVPYDDAGLLHRACALRLSAAKMKRWNPVPFLGGSSEDSTPDSTAASSLETALIVINTPIIRRDVFATVWKNGACASSILSAVSPHPCVQAEDARRTHTASIRYCADGGANRVYDAFGGDDACVCPRTARNLSWLDLTGALCTDSFRTSSRETSTRSGTT